MNTLTVEEYQQTKEKLLDLENRLSAIEQRNDLSRSHKADVRRSYHTMLRQYQREIKLYEAAHPLGQP